MKDNCRFTFTFTINSKRLALYSLPIQLFVFPPHFLPDPNPTTQMKLSYDRPWSPRTEFESFPVPVTVPKPRIRLCTFVSTLLTRTVLSLFRPLCRYSWLLTGTNFWFSPSSLVFTLLLPRQTVHLKKFWTSNIPLRFPLMSSIFFSFYLFFFSFLLIYRW